MSFGPNITAQTIARPPAVRVQTEVPFEFIHINKCGGSSVEIALGLEKTHDTALDRRDQIGNAAWQAAFTFTIVRNPFERVASIYYYRVRTDMTGLANRHLNFNDWIARVFGENDPAYWEDSPLMRPATEWVFQDGKLLVDHVARLEQIAAEWPKICKKLGITRNLQLTNQNSHPAHGAIYSDHSRKLIETIFAADLDQFNYRFEAD